MAEVLLALGSNLGDRLGHLRAACEAVERMGRITGRSRVYETAPEGYLDQGPFLNAVIAARTELGAPELLQALLAVEAARGRVRGVRNGPRTLDLDLLLYDALVLDVPGLTLPHPRLHERAFVLAPLCDVAPLRMHPTLRRTMRELWEALPGAASLLPIAEVL